jgi:hypothetical protein
LRLRAFPANLDDFFGGHHRMLAPQRF